MANKNAELGHKKLLEMTITFFSIRFMRQLSIEKDRVILQQVRQCFPEKTENTQQQSEKKQVSEEDDSSSSNSSKS